MAPAAGGLVHPAADVLAAGVDGCRAGWVAAIARAVGGRPPVTELRLFAAIEDVIAWRAEHGAPADERPPVAIDVPIGLPALAGPRACDLEARALLGPRWMCVFAPPDRELLGLDFEQAREVVRRRRAAAPDREFQIANRQTMNITAKIAEVDRVLRDDPARQAWLLEAHPEVSFRIWAGEDLERKRTPAGRSRRLDLVARRFPDAQRRLLAASWPRTRVAVDDLLDAYAALWTALRVAAGTGEYRVLGDATPDAFGLRRRIVA